MVLYFPGINSTKRKKNNHQLIDISGTMIKAIDSTSVHRICSGQVIVNLALAVKELVENSLDAGATNIEVRFKEYGSELIEVLDNGCGVEEKNFEGLGLKHHTSKLEEFSDLTDLDTFGFRGEALSSLCALSNLSVTTRHDSSATGYHLEFDHNGIIVNKSPCARQIGTTVCLQGLFTSLPVRRKEFLQNLKREFGKMTNVLTAYSLIGLNIRFLGVHQSSAGKRTTILSTSGLPSIKENIASIFGPKQLAHLKDLVPKKTFSPDIMEEFRISEKELAEEHSFLLEGYISTCEHGKGRSSTDRQFFFINNRPCEIPKVSKIVNGMYHQYNRHQYPFVLLNVTTKKDTIDINVTPDKRKILVHQEKFLLATLKTTLQSLFDSILPNVTSINGNETGSLLNHIQRSLDKQTELLSTSTSSSGKRTCESPEDKESKVAKLSNSQSFSVHSTDNILSHKMEDSFTKVKDKNLEVKQTVPLLSDSINSANLLESLRKFQRVPSSSPATQGLKKKAANSRSITDFLCVGESTELKELNKTNSDDWEISAVVDSDTVNQESSFEKSCHESFIEDDEVEILEEEKSKTFESEYNKETCDVTSIDTDVVLVDDRSSHDKKTVLVVDFSVKSLKNRMKLGEKAGSSGLMYRNFRAKIAPNENQAAEQELKKQLRKDMFKDMEVLGQFNLGFILAKLGTDIFIVDQHATDEKYNFETLQNSTVFQTQKLVIKQKLELTAVNEAIVLDNMDIFNKNGFQIEENGEADAGRKLSLASVPMSKRWTFGKDDVEELIFMLSDSPGAMCRPSKVHQMFASRACRKSVMIGQALTNSDMKKLLVHMGEIEQPWNCPHGRPTIRHLFNLALLQDAPEK